MDAVRHRYFMIYKPCGYVSQFRSPDKVRLLGELPFPFPENTHAIGRLDKDSEGLLLLTTNKKVTKLLFESAIPHKRTYLVQVRHHVAEATLQQLQSGVTIPVEGGRMYTTPPIAASIVPPPLYLSPAPFQYANQVQSTWLQLTLTQGKYRQVRKMVAALRHRCMRLIRTSIEDLELADLPPGGVREIEEDHFFKLLHL